MNFIILFINKTRVVALTPALQPIDGVAVSYIDAAVALGNTINEMDKYYIRKIIKTMRLRKENAAPDILKKIWKPLNL